ncbi:MAG: dihydrolipoamide acetyltransferase family protein [bacterium]|jgi:pyruvate dehydrogenase E2 component (dihydrolipoamide acetyltransferase)
MATIIEMPKLSDTMVHGKVITWYKAEGDPVEEGMAIAELETDKATMELESSENGILKKILVDLNEAVPIGNPIAIVAEADEDISALLPVTAPRQTEPDVSQPTNQQVPPIATALQSMDKPINPLSAQPLASAASDSSRVFITPSASRIAAEHGIDVQTVKGSGPSGRIIKRDIEQLLENSSGEHLESGQVITEDNGYQDRAFSSIRETLVNHLIQRASVPSFSLEIEVNAEPLLQAVEAMQALAEGVQITVTDVLMKACTLALQRNPELNSQFMDDRLRIFKSVNLGIAAATEQGLMVPVIRQCEQKSVLTIARERSVLLEKCKQNGFSASEMEQGTFTLSNLGMYGISRFKAVLNPPQAATLAVGAVRDEAVVCEGQIVPGKRLSLSLTADQRAIDGAEGAKFLQDLKQILESPVCLAL